jgi:hypothetical protein
MTDKLDIKKYIRNVDDFPLKGIYSKSDAVRSSLNNIIKDYEMTTLGTR